MIKSILVLCTTLCMWSGVVHADSPDTVLEASRIDTYTSWVVDTYNLSPKLAREIVKKAIEEAININISPRLILAMISTESSFKITARSRKGAIGLMQILPRAHREIANSNDLYSLGLNIKYGASIFKDCLKRHSGNIRKALMAYNGSSSKKYSDKILAMDEVIKKYVVVEYASI